MSAVENEELFTVPDKKGRPVPAKMLTMMGSRVLDDKDRPIVAPASYDAGKFAAMVQANAAKRVLRFGSLPSRELEELKGFGRGLRYDLQRTYNGSTSGGVDRFVDDFTPAASFALGYTAASLGVPENVTMLGGGLHNIEGLLENRHQNIWGWLGNNPANVPYIELGYKYFVKTNPVEINEDYVDPETGVMRQVLVGRTGYTGLGTGWDTPAEMGPGPGVAGPAKLEAGETPGPTGDGASRPTGARPSGPPPAPGTPQPAAPATGEPAPTPREPASPRERHSRAVPLRGSGEAADRAGARGAAPRPRVARDAALPYAVRLSSADAAAEGFPRGGGAGASAGIAAPPTEGAPRDAERAVLPRRPPAAALEGAPRRLGSAGVVAPEHGPTAADPLRALRRELRGIEGTVRVEVMHLHAG